MNSNKWNEFWRLHSLISEISKWNQSLYLDEEKRRMIDSLFTKTLIQLCTTGAHLSKELLIEAEKKLDEFNRKKEEEKKNV